MSHVLYASAVGSLMYSMVCTRLKIAHVVGIMRRYMSKLGKEHWATLKRVFRYLCGTTTYGICYQGRLRMGKVLEIHGFVDVDRDIDLVHKISTSGYVFNQFGGEIICMRKRYSVVTLSTIEFEYVEATHASKEIIWL
jgi:ATP-binding cassette subfamily B (MDR/TAP) protein 1